MKYKREDTRSQNEQAKTKSNSICEENKEIRVRNRDERQEQGKLTNFYLNVERSVASQNTIGEFIFDLKQKDNKFFNTTDNTNTGKIIASFLKKFSGEFIAICKERLTEGELYDSMVSVESNSPLGNDSQLKVISQISI